MKKTSKITFFNSDEEEQRKDAFLEYKDSFGYYLDSVMEKNPNKKQYTRCNLCQVNFNTPLELSVHSAFDNAHKMMLREKFECIYFERN